MSQLKLIPILAVFLITGCSATQLQYAPKNDLSVIQAIETLEHVINQNPDKRNIELISANERFMVLTGTLPRRQNVLNLPYRQIGKVNLHSKGEWFIVTFLNTFGAMEYRHYNQNEKKVKQLIDAVYVLKSHKPNQYQSNWSISKGEAIQQKFISVSVDDTEEDDDTPTLNTGHFLEKVVPYQDSINDVNEDEFDLIAEKLKKLKELKDSNLLTPEEFEEIRKALVDRI